MKSPDLHDPDFFVDLVDLRVRENQGQTEVCPFTYHAINLSR